MTRKFILTITTCIVCTLFTACQTKDIETEQSSAPVSIVAETKLSSNSTPTITDNLNSIDTDTSQVNSIEDTQTSPNSMDMIGIQPYIYSEEESNLLGFLHLNKDVTLLTFKAPNLDTSIAIETYVLDSNLQWQDTGSIKYSVASPEQEDFEGKIGLITNDDHTFELIASSNVNGSAIFQSNPIELDRDVSTSMQTFLQEYKPLSINESIPVALMVYDDSTNLTSYSLNDYYHTEVFEGRALIQAVVVSFVE